MYNKIIALLLRSLRLQPPVAAQLGGLGHLLYEEDGQKEDTLHVLHEFNISPV